MAVYLPLKACRRRRYRVIRLIRDSAEGRSGMPLSSAKPSEIMICKDEAVGRIMQEEGGGEMPPLHNPKPNMQNAANMRRPVSRRTGSAFRISGGNK